MHKAEPRMPTIFIGHGSPMETLGGRFAQAWRDLGARLPRPRAVLVVSAHWFIADVAVTAMARPRTIHDFHGFAPELHRIHYPAPGAPWLAARVADALAPMPVNQNADWGLDHGAWAVLRHLFPDADIPVVQFSIDRTRPGAAHFDLGRRLRALRDEGILIIGSGDVVHNLRAASFADDAPVLDWAERFNAFVKAAISARRWDELIDYAALGDDARLSIPTPDHYLPLLYVLGCAHEEEQVSFFTDEIALSSISMLGVSIG
ncbi:MAG: 4,5-DOPA dioxygenase extradiol [Sphingomonadales bacterium]|nr:4,5-DOPA dioxygenase extradiol [Sphingomonadales bacterium]